MNNAISLICRAVLAAGLALPSIQGWACQPDEVSQLRMGNYNRLATDAFPALSSNGEEVALLVAPNPMAQAINLEVRSATSDKLKREYVLRSVFGGPERPTYETTIVQPNKYLREGGFTAMHPLFTPDYIRDRPVPAPPTYEHSVAELHLSIDHESKIVTVSLSESRQVLLRKQPASETVRAYEDACPGGTFAAWPYSGWIDQARRLVVIKYAFGFNDSCDLPEIWHVVRLDAAK